MRTIGTGHGPAVVLNSAEMEVLFKASAILKEARKSESDNGELSVSNYPEVAVAEAALIVVKRYFDEVQRYAIEKSKGIQ